MAHYVYKITNKLNGKWYIGKRKHKTPYSDPYMGSGKLILEAIKKYGKNSFDKMVLKVFDTNEEAAKYEASLVTKETISTSMSYNMHEGGHGGFAHLNDGSKEHKDRSKLGAQKSSGRYHPNWGKQKFRKNDKHTLSASKKAIKARKAIKNNDPDKWKKIYEKVSEYQKNYNFMKNKVWCVPINAKNSSIKRVYDENNIPEDWIHIKEYRDKKKKKSGTYGKFWINNPLTRKNKYCSGPIPKGWIKGRVMFQLDVD